MSPVEISIASPLTALAVMVIAFAASLLAAVAGFGGAALLLPVLIAVFGTRAAIPILTLAQLAGNGSRVWFNRRELDLRVVAWFTLGGVPLALLGGYLFAGAPLRPLTRLLGGFLLFVVIYRRMRTRPPTPPPLPAFAAIGAGASFLSALLGSVGPLMAPFFLAYGLVKGAYIGTEALATVVMHLAKLVAYHNNVLLTPTVLWTGILLSPVMIAGSWAGKRIIDRLSAAAFTRVIEATLLAAGAYFLVTGG